MLTALGPDAMNPGLPGRSSKRVHPPSHSKRAAGTPLRITGDKFERSRSVGMRALSRRALDAGRVGADASSDAAGECLSHPHPPPAITGNSHIPAALQQ